MRMTFAAQQLVNSNNAVVQWEIVGVTTGSGIVNLRTGELYPDNPVTIDPYDESSGKPRIYKKFKVPQYPVIQMRDHLNWNKNQNEREELI